MPAQEGRRRNVPNFSPCSGTQVLYLHGAYTWQELPPGVPDENPGSLAAQSISIQPPGNRVRSYFDVVTPDEVRWAEVRVGLMDFVGRLQRGPLPWSGQSGRCYFRIGMELALAQQWHKELAILYRTSQALRLAHPT
ncbi:MAG TPA: hypothetical protein VIV60_21585 [Polyangiaceae bacterium]